MDIKQLQYFVVSVDLGSFHAAADTLMTTQPNISKVVKSLEEELGMVLLTRNRNGVKITPEGESIYKYAIDVIKNIKIIHELKRRDKEIQLNIGTANSNKLAMVISDFYNIYNVKNVKLNCWEGNVEELIVQVHRRVNEIGFIYISDKNFDIFLGQIKNKNLEFCELTKSPLYLFVGKNNPYFNRTSIDEDEIRKMKLIQYNDGIYSVCNQIGFLKENVIYGMNQSQITYTNSDNFLIQMLKNTDYCSIGSSFSPKKNKEYEINAIPIEKHEKSVSFGYIKRTKNQLSDIAQKFIEYLKVQIYTDKI